MTEINKGRITNFDHAIQRTITEISTIIKIFPGITVIGTLVTTETLADTKIKRECILQTSKVFHPIRNLTRL